MTFQRTFDLGLVKSILTEPRVWRQMASDNDPPPQDFQPNSDPRIWLVTARIGADVGGLFVFIPTSPVYWETHVAMLPKFWGPESYAAGRAIVPWIFERTTCLRIHGTVASHNRTAIRFAEQAMQMERVGVQPRSFLRNGKVIDQILFGVSKP